ncbi:MAG: Mg-protoporphyrin IX methyl transferase [Candidatus Omnitrophica bacterium ADurb.Bin277]|nr:MAG: Mg-protoporphyrin IX methyl transferase [Candidatus Omnitrophica bacterium ADurb.Bin277]
MSIIRKMNFRSCIDVGCGYGYMIQPLLAEGKIVSACDLSPLLIERNKKMFPGVHFETLDISSGSYSGGARFDMVICGDVLESAKNWRQAFDNLCAMSRRYVLITVPSGKMHKFLEARGHLRNFRKEDFEGPLRENDMKLLFSRYWGFPVHTLYLTMGNILGFANVSKKFLKKYGVFQKWVSAILYMLSFLNYPFDVGEILVLLAEKKSIRFPAALEKEI